jgi:hypothetical protein
MSPTEAKLDSAALRIFFNFLTLGPDSQYGSIFCSKTNTITFTVTDRELLGMEVWREDIVAYAHKKGVLYFLEHHTVIPLRVRLHYTAFVKFAADEANHTLVQTCAKPAHWYSDLADGFPPDNVSMKVVGAKNPFHNPFQPRNPMCSSVIEPLYLSLCLRNTPHLEIILIPRDRMLPYTYAMHIVPLTLSQWRVRTSHLPMASTPNRHVTPAAHHA